MIKKITSLIIFSSIILMSCNSILDNQEVLKQTELTIPEKISIYYGVTHFKEIKTIAFNFNVKKAGKHIVRHWKWNTKTNQVYLLSDTTKIEFIHNNCKSKQEIEFDKKFINDSYWLLFPCHLVWDKDNYKYSVSQNVISPILKRKSTKLTISYILGDGYTPNDVYELYINEKNEIIEWVYRKNGSIIPTKITTWEKTLDIEGFKTSTLHTNKTDEFKVWFDAIKIEK